MPSAFVSGNEIKKWQISGYRFSSHKFNQIAVTGWPDMADPLILTRIASIAKQS